MGEAQHVHVVLLNRPCSDGALFRKQTHPWPNFLRHLGANEICSARPLLHLFQLSPRTIGLMLTGYPQDLANFIGKSRSSEWLLE